MHPKFKKADELSKAVIGAAIEVHRVLGPGLLESIYEQCLLRELELRGIKAVSQKRVRIEYKGLVIDHELRCDILCEDCLLVENKACENVLPVALAQAITYMKLLDAPVGLIFNYHEAKLTDGLKRLIIPGSNRPD